ncbi:50S ribosomal protein L2 [Candidatus Woesearchaeota archaeon CG_4_10_14_0_2_um_filter_57_5]|nr:MAG: 50S ribosomal protein L2 [Candidatus Woesearchaeota archaeon CG1_02_57_44]PIN70392.1 MAG: 50S ribosomal protein L2 [Candidatus Woesearchaeota archaeon CG11_big_fil_rev_8_21_14_0_20_57_5]PIZ52795.1 MAG: 50S ribosomal protein L2 [Candidatus Woesearchaeota archaeon CG_4_10_14_0_2_um_filter_57_5]
MPKNLIQQKRGKGSLSYRSPSHRFGADIKHRALSTDTHTGTVMDIVHSPGHSSPLCKIRYADGTDVITVATDGIFVKQQVVNGADAEVKSGNTLPLSAIPDGTLICNIEGLPGDGGKFVRSSGGTAKVISHTVKGVVITMPSKKQRTFLPSCRATIGVAAGSGRREKPFLKAGRKHHAMKARNKMWPTVSGAAMNALSHPLGGSRSSRKGRPTIAPKNAPPGRKVGMIRPRHTGRNK